MSSDIIPKFDLKFFSSWIVCSIVMFGLFYGWHGAFLNDLSRIHYPLHLYLAAAGVVYLGIGLIITVLTFYVKTVRNSFKYGIIIGCSAGVFMYALSFILGLGFYTSLNLKMIVFDFVWQVLEQGIGGVVCGWVYRIAYNQSRISA